MRRFRTAVIAAACLAALCGIFLVHEGRAEPSPGAAVTIDNFSFAPAAITVKRGTTVTWTNQDDDVHTVKSEAGPQSFKSAALDTGDSFAVTFAEAGTYRYICSVHPYMHGTVVVE